ncbi:MAG: molybdenum cofactor carrier protein [Candidatus Rokubacteria bacterium]|nr:molybdenum cofactor carrier protein [Candidatus Rokubacteria bacterium]
MRPPRVPRLPIVGVLGSGTEAHAERAEAVGAWLATERVHLLTGAGGGVMEAVSRAFYATPGRTGLVIGIVPGVSGGRPAAGGGYPNPWVEVPVYTHLPLSGRQGTDPLSRNHINVLTSDVLIALPGSHGTASEVRLAVRYGRPLVAYLSSRSQIPGLPAAVRVEPDLEQVKGFVRAQFQ